MFSISSTAPTQPQRSQSSEESENAKNSKDLGTRGCGERDDDVGVGDDHQQCIHDIPATLQIGVFTHHEALCHDLV